ncbi:MAG: NADP-dependent isocitrate dehydrogenase, partial [Actinobacteria bacterium]|nr:NADP-dependent isocitrate dehydrogenase [Actinomycetota bacterium]MSY13402.1 NADP-dependent isocitrate dehydrogenase [Actinomycetota bacterium]
MTANKATIVYTFTDEAPLLATYSFLPIIQAYAGVCGVEVESRDISLAARILAQFPDHLTEAQRVPDSLAELGQLALTPEANIIKLPNVSASLPQLKAAIKELQGHGYALPDYPDELKTDENRNVRARYDRVKGSAVNPVLREGNSDRRAPLSVKDYARKHPHSMGKWSADSKTHVSTMTAGDFFGNEKSVTVPTATDVRIELVATDGNVTVLKAKLSLQAGEIIDGTFMSKKALVNFLAEQVADAKAQGVLFSLHLKATMMKVSDPIMFGHAVRVFFADVFAKFGDALASVGADPNNGLGAVLDAAEKLPAAQRDAVLAAIEATYATAPDLAMVDSDRGITNLHVPSDVIIDASMPAMIRTSGNMWNKAGGEQNTKAVIP